jgi:hypothetical protein
VHQRPGTLYLTTVNLAELRLGIERLPIGARRSRLQARISEVIALFGERRTLVFDATAARVFAILVARAPRAMRSAWRMGRLLPSPPHMGLRSRRGILRRSSRPACP